MKNIYIITGILVFVLMTVIVLASGNSSTKKVQFTNQNLVLNHENTEINNEDVSLNLNKSNITNSDIKSSNKDFELQGTGIKLSEAQTENQDTDIDYEPFSNQGSGYDNQDTDYNSNNIDFDNELQSFDNQKSKLKDIKARALNKSLDKPQPRERYMYRNIDWNTWKSEFVNKIVDDSKYIKSLDNYGIGTTIYYSFIVTYEGEIRNIVVRSWYLDDIDKKRFADMIKNYEYQDITVFPNGTNKKTARVNAIMMIGTTEKKSRPSDFNENEQVKIKLPY